MVTAACNCLRKRGIASRQTLSDDDVAIRGAILTAKYDYYEFFAGVGMARMGLGAEWRCLFANDCDTLKEQSYAKNWDGEHFDARDVGQVRASDLDGYADLAWASFPCQDLSQAGTKKGIGSADGLAATRSGAVWPFLHIMHSLADEGRHPTVLALENVVGLLNANGGCGLQGALYCAGRARVPVWRGGCGRRPLRAPIASARFRDRGSPGGAGSALPVRGLAAIPLAYPHTAAC